MVKTESGEVIPFLKDEPNTVIDGLKYLYS